LANSSIGVYLILSELVLNLRAQYESPTKARVNPNIVKSNFSIRAIIAVIDKTIGVILIWSASKSRTYVTLMNENKQIDAYVRAIM